MKKLAAYTLAMILISATAAGLNAQAAGGDAKAGKALYNTQCAMCHGTSGKGDGPAGKSLKPTPRDFSKGKFLYGSTDAKIAAFIKKGKAPMPGYSTLSAKQLSDLVAYIRALKK
jgi:high-affinity iron transporter